MRRFGVLMAWVALSPVGLAAQHRAQFEVGAFGSYTHYDPAFGLATAVGGGARLGYLVSDAIGIEGDVLFQPEYVNSSTTLEPLIAGASLVLNVVHGERLMAYVLGGYSLLDFGTRAPYHFTDNAVHGGAGVRLFLTNRVALRAEGRALYTPSTRSSFGPTTAKHYVATVGLSVFHLGAHAPTVVAATPPPPPPPPPPPAPPKCPAPPPGTPVDSLGCALPVAALPPPPPPPPPATPKCPAPPPGTPVDSLGCALPVPVVVTPPPPPPPPAPPKCPPAPPGSKVDANGCLVLFAPESTRAAVRPTLVLRGVNFETARSALTPDSYAVLDAVAASLVANPEIRIEIAGYTDNTGSRFLNFRLSQARAARVRAYLAQHGVAPARMVARGFGATGFVAPNTTPEGRAQNRRVELHKLP